MHLTSYDSRVLNGGQINYPIIKKKCLALNLALKKLKPLLTGVEYIYRTDLVEMVRLLKQGEASFYFDL